MSHVEQIRKRLADLRAKVTTLLVLDGTARLAGMVLGVVAVSFALDRVFKLEVAARAVLLVSALAGLAWCVWRYLVRRIRAVPGDDPLAVAVESVHPELRDRLISAVQLARETDPERYGMSPQLIEDTLRDAEEPVRRTRFGEVLALGRVLRTVILGALAVGLLALGAFADSESASIWFQRNVLLRNVRWPQKTYLVVDPDRFPNRMARIVRGQDLVVTAWVDQEKSEVYPETVVLHWEDSEGQHGEATMKTDVQSWTYRHEFKEVMFPITFHLEGGDEVTEDHEIALMRAPEVEELEIEVAFPDYAGRDPIKVDRSLGDPEVLVGGRVTVRGRSTKPLESMEVVLGEGEESTVPGTLSGDRAFETTFAPRKTVLAGIRLRDTDGLSNPTLAPRFLVRVVRDRAPKVRLQLEGIGPIVVPVAVLPYRLRLRDDVKVMDARIEAKKAAGDQEAPEPEVTPVGGELGVPEADLRGEIELGRMKPQPGAFVVFTAFARDNAQPDIQEGKSDPVSVKVVTIEDFLSEMLRRQQEQRRLFAELIEQEKRLRDRLLDLRDAPPEDPDELRQALDAQAREQRAIARRTRSVERAFSQIFDEMRNNRVAEASQLAELRNNIVGGLERLRTGVMTSHARTLELTAPRAAEIDIAGETGAEIHRGYEDVIAAMKRVLAQMEKGEGFSEILEAMRGLIDWQEKVRGKTEKKLDAIMRELFGPGGGDDDADGEKKPEDR